MSTYFWDWDPLEQPKLSSKNTEAFPKDLLGLAASLL